MKEKLLEIFNSKNYQPKNFQELSELLYLEPEQISELEKVLNQLLDEYEILLSRKKRYILPRDVHIHKGYISIKNPDFGFITCPDFPRDFYVSKTEMNGAMDKDYVVFSIISDYNGNSDFKQEARVIDILQRNIKVLVGEIYQKKNRHYLSTTMYTGNVRIVGVDECREGDIVKAEIIDYDRDPIEAKIIERIGFKNDIGIDVLEIASTFNFPVKFTSQTMEAVKQLNRDIEAESASRRKPSLTKIITIDGEDAKDLDDAVSIKKLDNGNYLLGVYIADVSYYVKENSAIDQEAYERGTSVYLVDRVIPMLPQALSNDLCSLNPNTTKLVLACEMEINQAGEVINSEIFPSAIRTTYRMTYTNVNKILNKDPEQTEKYQDIIANIFLMRELQGILNKMRQERGALDFDVDEGKVIVDQQGVPVEIQKVVRGESERIIEEFMLIANETVASTIYHLDLPFIYRIHEEPNTVKLEGFKDLASMLGYTMKRKVNSRQLQDFLASLREEDSFLKTILLRTMAKAIYNERNVGHYGLASTCYTHFTSPIRRYPDLIVHRLLRKYLFDHDINPDILPGLLKRIADIAEQSSKKERDAIECEYQVDDMKKAEYMANYIGERFEGIISSVTKFGMFVSLENTVEGLVHISKMPGRYLFDSKTMSLIGINGKVYRLGDKVQVEVIKADKKMREIDFALVYNDSIQKEKAKIKPAQKKHERGKYGEGKRRRQKQKSKS
ncbi:MAG: ribonuclease R [Acholeplasmataceae bacterium]|nr:ribonuclease R [Acholeplasmataceae bacterium]